MSRLAVRLGAVLTAVAVASVAVFALIVFFVDRADTRNAASQTQQTAVTSMVADAEAAYQRAGGWGGADLTGVASVAADNRFGVRLTTPGGAVIVERGAADPGTEVQHLPIRAGSATVADLAVTYPAQRLSAADQRLRKALERSILPAALAAAAVAVICAAALSRRLTRPITDLTSAVRRHSSGEPIGLQDGRPGPGEIGELSRAFGSMLSDLDRHEQVRRAMVADIAHELRTPIAVLQGETEALIDGVADFTPGAAASLHEEVVRLARLVADLQTLAAAQAAVLEMRPQPVDLAEVAATAGDAQRRAVHDAGLSWDADLTPVTVQGDPLRLHQVITNLLTNAIKYTPPGGQVRLTVRRDGPAAVLQVQDTGPGIPADELPHVFERFRRGGNHAVAGSGIGLAVTAELVAAHHGTVTITAPPLGGTCATVRLPVAPQQLTARPATP